MNPRTDPLDLTPEERLDALAGVLAEGILHLAVAGQLEEILANSAPGTLPTDGLPTGGKEGSVSNGP